MENRSEEYLEHAFRLTFYEESLRDEYETWLPARIFDVHGHANRAADVGVLPNLIMNRPLSTFPSYTIDDSRRLQSVFHPTKEIVYLRFAQPYEGIDWRGANAYLKENLSALDYMAVCGDPRDEGYTIKELEDPRAFALKMYYFFTTPPVKTIYEYFTPNVLEAAERLRKPIILHPPLPVPECMDQFRRMLDDFPDLIVIIAHLGLYSEPVGRFRGAFEELAQYPNVWADTSMCHSSELFRVALETLGSQRIMYGSDQPISLIRAAQFYDNEFRRPVLLPDYRYHWVREEDWIRYRGRYSGMVHGHFENLRAIREIVDSFPGDVAAELKQCIFYNNAARLFSIK
jgi:hypothetical protein